MIIKNKKGATKILISLVLGIVIFVVLLSMYNRYVETTNKVLNDKLSDSFRECWAESLYAYQDNPADFDKDGLPNDCDPCIDIPEDFNFKDITKYDNNKYQDFKEEIELIFINAYNKKYIRDINYWAPKSINIKNKKPKRTYSFEDEKPNNPDNDGDNLHDLCERTPQQLWVEADLFQPIFSSPPPQTDLTSEEWFLRESMDDAGRIKCKFWYSRWQCCSRGGEDGFYAITQDGSYNKESKIKCSITRPLR